MTGLPRAGAFSKPHDYKQNVQKMRGLPKKWVLTGKQFEDFRKKNQKFHSSHGDQTKGTTRPQGQKFNMNPCKQDEINWSKIEQIIQIKTVGTLQE